MILLEKRGTGNGYLVGCGQTLLCLAGPHRGEYRESNAPLYARLEIWVNVPQRLFPMSEAIIGPKISSQGI